MFEPPVKLPLSAPATAIYLGQALDVTNPCYNTAEVVELPADADLSLLRRALEQIYSENEQLRVKIGRGSGGLEQELLPLADFVSVCELFPLTKQGGQDGVGLDSDSVAGYELPAPVAAWALNLQQLPMNLDEGQTVRSAALSYGGKLWLFHAFHHVVADGFAAFSALSRLLQVYQLLVSGQDVPAQRRLSLAQLVEADAACEPLRAEDTADWLAEVQAEDPDYLQLGDTTISGQVRAASNRTHRRVFSLSADVQAKVLEVSQKFSVSWVSVLIAATASYLNRAGGHAYGSFAVPQMNRMVNGRGRDWGRAAAQSSCTAVSLLPVRVHAGGEAGRLLDEVASQLERNQRFALSRTEDLERLAAHQEGRLFGTQINVVPFDSSLPFGQERAQIHNISAGPVNDMTVCYRGRLGAGKPLACEVDGNIALYSQDEIAAHADRLQRWVELWADAALAERSISELSIALDSELAILEEFTASTHELDYKNLLTRFLEQVAKTPQAPALRASAALHSSEIDSLDFQRELTYTELAEQAQNLAARLQLLGVKAGDVVGLRVDRSIEQYLALYALLYLGAVYLPILPELPASRVQSMLEDSGCRLVLESPQLETLDLASGESIADVRICSWAEVMGLEAPETQVNTEWAGLDADLDETAYILFTSGSTGRPKGVPISHRALDNRLRWQQSVIPTGEGKRVLHKTPISFDVHVWELYWPLTEGACVVIAAPDGQKDPLYLARLIKEQEINCLHFVPTMFSAFLASAGAREVLAGELALETVVCSGEALSAEQVQLSQQVLGISPLNLYGPTEAAIDVTYFDTSLLGERTLVPIGYPVWNTRCTVVDTEGQIVPAGTVGELVLGGVQLAPGYLNNEQATQKAFGYDSARQEPFYRTGDLAAWGADGAIYYRGRRDHQVKIRGQRLELGEIEATLAAVPGVSAAVVGVRKDTGEPALAAYLESTLEREEVIAAARSLCEERLSDYMVPAFWFVLEQLPVGSSGKADRKYLETLPLDYAASQSLPQSYREQVLCQLFAEVTGLPRYGVDDDFFTSGGSSLLALRLLALIEEQLGVRLSIASLFSASSPAALAKNFGQDDGAELSPILPLRKVETAKEALVFLPPAGGLGWCYSSFLPHVPADVSVYALQAEQLADTEADFPVTLEEAATSYCRRLLSLGYESYRIFGWSVGGTLAPEVARLAQGAGAKIGSVVLLDAYPASDWSGLPDPDEQESYLAILRMAAVAEPDEELTMERTLELVRESGSAIGQLAPEVLARSITCMRASTAMMRASTQQNYPGKLTIFAVEHPEQPYLAPQHWAAYASDLQVYPMPGGHVDVVRGEGAARVCEDVFGGTSSA